MLLYPCPRHIATHQRLTSHANPKQRLHRGYIIRKRSTLPRCSSIQAPGLGRHLLLLLARMVEKSVDFCCVTIFTSPMEPWLIAGASVLPAREPSVLEKVVAQVAVEHLHCGRGVLRGQAVQPAVKQPA